MALYEMHDDSMDMPDYDTMYMYFADQGYEMTEAGYGIMVGMWMSGEEEPSEEAMIAFGAELYPPLNDDLDTLNQVFEAVMGAMMADMMGDMFPDYDTVYAIFMD